MDRMEMERFAYLLYLVLRYLTRVLVLDIKVPHSMSDAYRLALGFSKVK